MSFRKTEMTSFLLYCGSCFSCPWHDCSPFTPVVTLELLFSGSTLRVHGWFFSSYTLPTKCYLCEYRIAFFFFLISVTLLIKIASWFFFLLSLSTLLPVWLLLLTLEEVVRTWLVKSWRVHSQWMEIPVAVVVVCLDLVRVQCLWNFSKPWLNVKGYSNPLLSYLQLLHINM